MLEGLDRVLSDLARVCAETCIECGLPATGLIAGEIDVNAEAAQYLDHRDADLGKEGIDQACDEQLDVMHV